MEGTLPVWLLYSFSFEDKIQQNSVLITMDEMLLVRSPGNCVCTLWVPARFLTNAPAASYPW